MKRVAIETLGCKANQYDSELLKELFRQENVACVSSHEIADVYIVNSCTVTGKADAEARHLLRRFRRQNPAATLVITGCYAQTQSQSLAKLEGVHYVVGNTLKPKIVEILKNKTERPTQAEVFTENVFQTNAALPLIPLHAVDQKTRVFLKIQDGCDDFCTFCLIPYARGKNRSLPPEAVVHQIQILVNEGVKEIVLTGISLGSYGVDLSPKSDLATLVKKIDRETTLLRLRISSLEPEDVSDGLLSACQGSEKFCPHFHLPLQSGDDAILQKMRRNYTVSYYEALIEKIHKRFPDIFIGTDVICGFPGETLKQATHTVDFLKNIIWAKLHVFPYSPRQGTAAATFLGQLPRHEILKRGYTLRMLSEERYQQFLLSQIGKKTLALVEKGGKKALARNYVPIYFDEHHAFMPQVEIECFPSHISQDGLLCLSKSDESLSLTS